MSNDKEGIFEICKQFNPNQYENIDLNRLATYTIWLLKENNIVITFENIVVALFIMFPEKFSLVGYKEYPDSTRVNRALLQLRPKYRNWATGNVKKGFTLTETGRVIVGQTSQLLNNLQFQSKKPVLGQSRTRDIASEMEQIINSPVYQKYLSGKEEEISKIEIFEFLRAMPYTPLKVLRAYMKKLLNEVRKSGHPKSDEIIDFLNWIQRRHQSVFAEKK